PRAASGQGSAPGQASVPNLLGRRGSGRAAWCRARTRLRRHLWRRARRRTWRQRARGRSRVQVFRSDVPDQGQVLTDAENDRHRTRAVQLRLEETRVDLLQLLDAVDALDVRAATGLGGLLKG